MVSSKDGAGGEASVRKAARDRVLDAATDLFYREGIRAVGIDTIVARSGVAKMSLYRNFPSKDDLIVAFLERRNGQFFEWWEGVMERSGGDPRERLRGLVAATIRKVRSPGYRGCPFLNTSAEFPDPAHPARGIVALHKGEVRTRLVELARRLGAGRPEALAMQFVALMDGVYADPAAFAGPEAGESIVEAAEALIAAQLAGDTRIAAIRDVDGDQE
jgi:AcrR family transcriptional regulator